MKSNPKDKYGKKKVANLSVIPPASIIYEGLAMMDGAEKYGPFNWRENKVIAHIYIDACIRHLMSWWDGEDLSEDAKKHHLGHAKACLGILADAIETGNLIDDRPAPGAAAQLLKRHTKT
jgi:hypothetical protein